MYDYTTNELMTAEQFIKYVKEGWNFWDESIGEHESQYRSECAMFGDAGPGQGYYLNQMKQEMSSIAARYRQLTGRDPRQDAYPFGWDYNE